MNSNSNMMVVAPTFYPNMEDPRYSIALDLCKEAARLELSLLLVDASPDENIRQSLAQAGQPFVQVVQQQSPGKKGVALREGIVKAVHTLKESHQNDDVATFIAFQEPEKVDMLRHWKAVVDHMVATNSDVCVPARSEHSFQSSYPLEQYHSESFANAHLNALARRVQFPAIDWTAGPMALHTRVAHHWISYTTGPQIWDAQIVPLVRSQRWHAARVTSLEVDFFLPAVMKEMEEGSPEWNEKRLLQLNLLFELVGGALKADKE